MTRPYKPDESMLIPGFMELEELAWLHQQAARFDTVVEVGCWMGRSTSALAHDHSGRVFTVDHFEGSPSELDGAHAEVATVDVHSVAEQNLAAYPAVTIVRADSLSASRMFNDGSVGMVFLDGEHTREAVLIDLVAWRPKCVGLFCGHDRDWEGVYGALAVYGVPYRPGPGSIWYLDLIG